jgi:trans-aconitate methyltransferase
MLQETPYEYVVEVGCGNGLLMERVAAQAPACGATFVGLDMDPKVITANQEIHRGSRVQYYCCDSLQEFLGRAHPASVLVLAHGTFQCFTEAELANCLRWLVTHVPRGAVVVRDFTYADGQVEIHSRPAGSFTFCHNYEQLFAQAGFEAIRTRVAKVGANWKGVVVSARWTRPPSAGTS